MKKTRYMMLLGVLLGFGACQEAEYKLFNERARVQMGKDDEIRMNFFYNDRSVLRDTAYLTVNTIGDPEDRDRRISFEQITEYDVEYQYDDKGNPTDTIRTEKSNKAVAGVHYLPLDDPEMQKLLVIPANEVSVQVPIILLRDPSLRKEEVRLCLKLVETEDFALGEGSHLSRAIVFADMLTRPDFWTDRVAKYYFGAYSTRKHEFMYEVAREKIDGEWFKRLSSDYAEMTFFKNKFKNALAAFNADEANIASGQAPMREDPDDPESPLIVFP